MPDRVPGPGTPQECQLRRSGRFVKRLRRIPGWDGVAVRWFEAEDEAAEPALLLVDWYGPGYYYLQPIHARWLFLGRGRDAAFFETTKVLRDNGVKPTAPEWLKELGKGALTALVGGLIGRITGGGRG